MMRIQFQRCNMNSCGQKDLFHELPSQMKLFVMFDSPRLQPVVAGQRQRASVSEWHAVPGWFADRGTGCDQKPALEQVQSQT